jgi:hypothetical protein
MFANVNGKSKALLNLQQHSHKAGGGFSRSRITAPAPQENDAAPG